MRWRSRSKLRCSPARLDSDRRSGGRYPIAAIRFAGRSGGHRPLPACRAFEKQTVANVAERQQAGIRRPLGCTDVPGFRDHAKKRSGVSVLPGLPVT
jgi:hypothetical protein